MPFRVKIDGVEIECDSAVEASQLIAAMSKPTGAAAKGVAGLRQRAQKISQPRASSIPAHPQNGADFAGFLKELADKGRDLFVAIRNAGEDGIETHELAGKIGEKAQNIKFIMRRVTGTAARHGIDPEKVVKTERIFKNRKPVSLYKMSQEIRSATSGAR